MFERFTEHARHAVVEAQAEARALQHDWIGTEHLLLGLLRDTDDLPARVLERCGIGLEASRREVREIIGARDVATDANIPFTVRAKTVLEMSLREAQELGHDAIGSGHLLLALIHEGQGVAPQVLTRLGADLGEVEHDLLQRLPGELSETAKVLRRQVGSASRAARDLPAAGVAARLDSIDEKLTAIAQRLEAIEERLADD